MRISAESWLEAQYSVLGSALIDGRCVPAIMAGTCEEDYGGPCRHVFHAMRKLFLAGDPVDVVSVAAAMGPEYRSFLAQLMEITPTAARVEHYIALCREQARVLAMQELGRDLAVVDGMEDARDLVEQANSLLADRNRSGATGMAEAMRSFMERKTVKVSYLGWPVEPLGKFLFSGPGDFIILGAEPSVGKTAFALQCAWHWAKDHKVAFFSLETSAEKLFDRMMAGVAGLSMGAIKNSDLSDRDWERVAEASQEVVNRQLDLIPASGCTTADIRAGILEKGYEIVIVDYLQLVSASGGNRYEQVTSVSMDLHRIAQSLNVTVLGLSQLSRSDDDRTPRNSDLRESGQLEQDADVIMMLHLEKKSEPGGNRKLTVTKNKEGECFQTVLAFDGKHQVFSKASQSREVMRELVEGGKKIRRKNRMEAQQQFMSLPGEDFQCPF